MLVLFFQLKGLTLLPLVSQWHLRVPCTPQNTEEKKKRSPAS